MSRKSLIVPCAAVCLGAIVALPASAADEESTTLNGKMFGCLTNIDLSNEGEGRRFCDCGVII